MATTVKTSGVEEWRDSSLYAELMVSSLGRVKEKGYNKVTPDNGGGFRVYTIPAKILDPTESSATGDLTVSFRTCNSSAKTSAKVADLVATEFVKNTDTIHYTKVMYKDGNKSNVKASNLDWTGSGIYAK